MLLRQMYNQLEIIKPTNKILEQMATIKQYNEQTGGYKINIFVNGVYWCTTDMFKTLKRAKSHASDYWPKDAKITAEFKTY